jgi:hypothetical protein
MKKFSFSLTIAAAFMLAAPGFAGTETRFHKQGMADTTMYELYGNAYMGELDANGDGFVTWEEFHGRFPSVEREFFEVVDLDKDGFVSGEEWHMFRQAHGLNHPRRYHRTNLPDPKPFVRPMERVDANGDGMVTWDEFKAAFPQAKRNIFGAFDLDRNGVISAEEWAAFLEVHG